MKNPWTTLKKNVIYQNKYGFTLWDDDVINPKGGRGKYMVMEHYGCVLIVALTKDKKVILEHQWRYPIEQDIIEIPAGAIEPNDKSETHIETAKRELLEEVGVTSDDRVFLGSQFVMDGFLKMRSFLFLALDCQITKTAHQEETELIEVVKIPFDEVYKRVISSELQDGQTKLAILTVKDYLGRQKNGLCP